MSNTILLPFQPDSMRIDRTVPSSLGRVNLPPRRCILWSSSRTPVGPLRHGGTDTLRLPVHQLLPQRTGMIYKGADVDGIIMMLTDVQAHENPGTAV
jgi:hypothetical protein